MHQADSLSLRCHKKRCVSNDLLVFKGSAWANLKYTGVRAPRLWIQVRRSEGQWGVLEDRSVVVSFQLSDCRAKRNYFQVVRHLRTIAKTLGCRTPPGRGGKQQERRSMCARLY